jgi:predicted MFS family arabinose efflux permease
MLTNRWHILAVLFVTRTAFGFQFQTVASTAAFLQEQYAIGLVEIGTLIGLHMLPGIVLALPGGLLVRRFGDKTLCLASLFLMVMGGAMMGISDTYAGALAGRLVSGCGAVLLSVVLTKMTTDWFVGLEIVTAMSILLTSWPLGIALALVLQPPLASALGWPWVMHTAAALCGFALLLIAIFYQSPPGPAAAPSPPSPPGPLNLPPKSEALPTIIAGLIWGVFNVGLIMFFSFVPPLLVKHGAELTNAAFLTSLGLWVMIASVPVGGYLVQRSGRFDAAVMLFSGLAGLALAALTAFPSLTLPLCIAIGVAVGPPPGAILAMPGRVLKPENRAVGLGLFMTVFYVLAAIGPALAGFIGDQMGASAPVLFGSFLFIGVVPLVMLFRVFSYSRRRP